MNNIKIIDSFSGQYAFLSNFWYADVEFDGMIYPTNEHAYQAAKTLDNNVRKEFQSLKTPALAKHKGKSIRLRTDWELVKLDVMISLVHYKFNYHSDLKQKLIETGDAELIEGNTWGDTYWGICNGKGHNFLGKILMNVRNKLKK